LIRAVPRRVFLTRISEAIALLASEAAVRLAD
jgi:hypothetical protein